MPLIKKTEAEQSPPLGGHPPIEKPKEGAFDPNPLFEGENPFGTKAPQPTPDASGRDSSPLKEAQGGKAPWTPGDDQNWGLWKLKQRIIARQSAIADVLKSPVASQYLAGEDRGKLKEHVFAWAKEVEEWIFRDLGF